MGRGRRLLWVGRVFLNTREGQGSQTFHHDLNLISCDHCELGGDVGVSMEERGLGDEKAKSIPSLFPSLRFLLSFLPSFPHIQCIRTNANANTYLCLLLVRAGRRIGYLET